MIPILSSQFVTFPDVEQADADGLLAIGGNLESETLLRAFRKGIFPWYSEEEPICWYAPPKRCVLFPSKIKVTKSMWQILKSGKFKITYDEAFESVITHCATIERKGQEGTWIVAAMQKAYIQLHKLKVARSVEVWENGVLVGGLYGVVIGNVFSGESMFSLCANASKAALITLCHSRQYDLIDCQIPSAHLLSMGAEVISRASYLQYLQ